MGAGIMQQNLSRPVATRSAHDGKKTARPEPLVAGRSEHSRADQTEKLASRSQQRLATALSREPLAVRSSGDVETFVAEEILDAARVIALELYLPVLDSATAGELRFEV